jgi:hypothetical protein
MDDIGLHLARRPGTAIKRLGRLLVVAMPWLLGVLSSVGTLAMLWVGGGIVLHGSEELGLHGPARLAQDIQNGVADATGPLGGLLGWLTYALLSAVAGLLLGALVAVAVHFLQRIRVLKQVGA